ncbi:uncharacterized protein PV09_08600 [Verruconis gallopava]|uniref:Uncharacterized protein n=1 Tax=Verruconis gallopava TaxID=253628 RepID=A0A0D1XC24_9PEZI|nr:uncharacterized protein PV09_08600 [Verruconis gallopava]KIV99795.1 hypothetical protein PV09_08600 [Verruconis gallopava]
MGSTILVLVGAGAALVSAVTERATISEIDVVTGTFELGTARSHTVSLLSASIVSASTSLVASKASGVETTGPFGESVGQDQSGSDTVSVQGVTTIRCTSYYPMPASASVLYGNVTSAARDGCSSKSSICSPTTSSSEGMIFAQSTSTDSAHPSGGAIPSSNVNDTALSGPYPSMTGTSTLFPTAIAATTTLSSCNITTATVVTTESRTFTKTVVSSTSDLTDLDPSLPTGTLVSLSNTAAAAGFNRFKIALFVFGFISLIL